MATTQPEAIAVERHATVTGVFSIIGGPLAWFVELNAGYALAGGPCFSGTERLLVPPPNLSWSHPSLFVLLIVCSVIAFVAFGISFLELRRRVQATDAAPTTEWFAALWGAVLGGGFCAATLLTAVGLIVLPRCAG
jgi:hypothetical protein